MDDKTLILLIIPLVLIQLGLMFTALYDIYQRKGVRPPLPVAVWVLIVILGEMLGPVLYFLFGRKEEDSEV
jgi:hypothetical protein